MTSIAPHSVLRLECADVSCASTFSAPVPSGYSSLRPRTAQSPPGNAEHGRFNIHADAPSFGARASEGP